MTITDPPFPLKHGCTPGRRCGQCLANKLSGFPEAWPGNGRSKHEHGTTPPATSSCPHLGDVVSKEVIGGSLTWRECKAGRAPMVLDSGVSACVSCSRQVLPGAFRIGDECSAAKCSGHPEHVGIAMYAPSYPQPFPSWPVPGYGSFQHGKPVAWVPTPPEKVMQESNRAVVTVVVGEKAERCHAYTHRSHEAYARAHGADYIVLAGKTQVHPCFEKFRYRSIVESYSGGTFCLDASDTFVLPGTPSIWDEVPAGHVAMVRADLNTDNKLLMPWSVGETVRVAESQAVPVHPLAVGAYYNSGVWFGRPGQADYWTPPTKPTPGNWADEENHCRLMMFNRGTPIYDLDARWNWVWCDDQRMNRNSEAYILHFAGMDNDAVPAEWNLPLPEVRREMLLLLDLFLKRTNR